MAKDQETQATNEFSPTQAFHGWDELYSIVEYQIVTEDGIYKKDHTPEQYNGTGVLEVEVVHMVVYVDDGGRLQRQSHDIDEAMDEEDLTGGPIELDGTVIQEGTTSEVATKLTRKWSASLYAENNEKFQRGYAMVVQAGYIPAGTT